MRTIGVDYGTKRVGLAISDEAGQFALPIAVIQSTPDLSSEIAKLAEENESKEIVIGESRDYDMKANKIMPAIMALKKSLEDAGLQVFLESEFLTSLQAERLQGKHDMIDASAAALILQSFLDRRAHQVQS